SPAGNRRHPEASSSKRSRFPSAARLASSGEPMSTGGFFEERTQPLRHDLNFPLLKDEDRNQDPLVTRAMHSPQQDRRASLRRPPGAGACPLPPARGSGGRGCSCRAAPPVSAPGAARVCNGAPPTAPLEGAGSPAGHFRPLPPAPPPPATRPGGRSARSAPRR